MAKFINRREKNVKFFIIIALCYVEIGEIYVEINVAKLLIQATRRTK